LNSQANVLSLFAAHGNPLSKDDWGHTPLHYAASKGHFQHFRLLFEHAKSKNPTTQHGTSVLHSAAWNGNFLVCSLIVDYLKNKYEDNLVQFPDFFGQTPFHIAASCGNLEVCQLFLENYPDKNPKNRFGNTPLHEAARSCQYEVCKLIIDNVVDKNPGNNQGWTPQHFACETYNWSENSDKKSKLMSVNQLFVEITNGKNPKTNPFYLFGHFGYTPSDIAKGYHIMSYHERYFSLKFWIGLFFCLMLHFYMMELDSECQTAYLSMKQYHFENFGICSAEEYLGMCLNPNYQG
jgi:ankyrin repeat protein